MELGGGGQLGVGRVGDGERRGTLPPRFGQDRHDVGAAAALADAEDQGTVETRRTPVDREEARGGQPHVQAVLRGQQVARIARGVVAGAPGGDHDVPDVPARSARAIDAAAPRADSRNRPRASGWPWISLKRWVSPSPPSFHWPSAARFGPAWRSGPAAAPRSRCSGCSRGAGRGAASPRARPNRSPSPPTSSGTTAPPTIPVHRMPENEPWCEVTELSASEKMIDHITEAQKPITGKA